MVWFVVSAYYTWEIHHEKVSEKVQNGKSQVQLRERQRIFFLNNGKGLEGPRDTHIKKAGIG
jgi:hypothetical protein